MEITPSIIRRAIIFLAIAGAGGCWWFGVSILMPDLVYGWAAIALVPIFLAIAVVAGIFECGKGEWFKGQKLLPSLMIAGGIFLIYGGIMLHVVRDGDTPPSTAQAAAPKPAKPKKTLRFAKGQDVDFQSLIIFEFPSTGFHATERLELGQFIKAPFATFYTMYPPDVRAESYLVHIPKGANAYAVSKFVAENYEKLREDQGPADPKIDRRIPEKIRKQLGISAETFTHYIGEKVPFTGEIFIYHEPKLTKDQIGNLHDLFVKHGVVVTFRGPEHIAKMWADHGPRKD